MKKKINCIINIIFRKRVASSESIRVLDDSENFDKLPFGKSNNSNEDKKKLNLEQRSLKTKKSRKRIRIQSELFYIEKNRSEFQRRTSEVGIKVYNLLLKIV